MKDFSDILSIILFYIEEFHCIYAEIVKYFVRYGFKDPSRIVETLQKHYEKKMLKQQKTKQNNQDLKSRHRKKCWLVTTRKERKDVTDEETQNRIGPTSVGKKTHDQQDLPKMRLSECLKKSNFNNYPRHILEKNSV